MGLGAWKRELKDMVDNNWGNADTPECPECGAEMRFYGHDDSGDFEYGAGYWECSSCGFKIFEDEL